MWTTYKDYAKKIQGKGFAYVGIPKEEKTFVSCKSRATNKFAHKSALAYCVNLFLNPAIKKYFDMYGIRVNEDEYALAEMVQWVWRSRVRNGQSIQIYIPSKRMRKLFCDWLGIDCDDGNKSKRKRRLAHTS